MDQVKMEVSVSSTGGSLLLTYEIINGNPQSIYLYNVLLGHDADGRQIGDKNLALVAIEDGIVHVKKDHPGFPSDPGVFALPKEAYVTEVPGQSSFSETIEFKLPLAEWSAFPSSNPSPTTSGVAKGIDFSIAYKSASAFTQLRELEGVKAFRLVKGGVEATASEVVPKTQYLTSKVIPMEIPVEIKVAK